MKPTFNNADYYVDQDNWDNVYMNLDEAEDDDLDDTDLLAVHSTLLVGDGHGVYVPQMFVNNFDMAKWNVSDRKDDLEILVANPYETEGYWEAWDSILAEAFAIDEYGNKWTLAQVEGGLFAQLYIEATNEE